MGWCGCADALPFLLALVDPGSITFGSHWPFVPIVATLPLVAALDGLPMEAARLRQLACGNADSQFPRLAVWPLASP
jgi:hypothetical protein